MRHRHHGKKLNRSGSHRKALRMNLATELLTRGRIRYDLPQSQVCTGPCGEADHDCQARLGHG